MSPEKQTPQSAQSNPEMYVIPPVQTDALEQARIDAEEFKNTVNEASRSLIDVADVPGYDERAEVKQELANTETQRILGGTAIELAKRERIPIDNPTPQMMRKALGSPYYEDRLGRLAPREEEQK